MRCLHIHCFLSTQFEALGGKIAKDTSWFIYLPVTLSLFLATGIQLPKFDDSIETDMTSVGGVAIKTREYIQSYFPMNHSHDFDPGRMTITPKLCSLIILAKDGKSILRSSILKEILKLDTAVRELSIRWEERKWQYADICAKQRQSCFQTNHHWIEKSIEELEQGELRIKFPIDDRKVNQDLGALSLGGVNLDEDGNVLYANSFKLTYFLDSTNICKDVPTRRWEKHFLDQISNLHLATITVYKDAPIAPKELLKDLTARVSPFFFVSMCLVVVFTLTTTLKSNCLRSKPWTGIISVTASGMSLISTYGLLAYVGVDFIAACIGVSFLLIGIGMDDTFVMLSAWFKTDCKKSVKERMAETMAESGVSIALTSLTNVVAFGLGAVLATFEGIKIFTLYAAVALFFDFLYQITFVTGMLALTGKAEERGLHSLTFCSINNSCTGKAGSFCNRKSNRMCSETNYPFITFFLDFWNNLSNILTTKLAKIGVFLLYLAYVIVAVLGYKKLAFSISFDMDTVYDSYQYAYSQIQEKNYRQYQYRIQIIIPNTLNYADPKIQQEVEEMIMAFESHPLFSGPLLTESWLRSFRKFLSDERISLLLRDYNLTNMETFTYILHRMFLNHPLAKRFKNDIVFDANQTEIVASRFLLQTNFTNSVIDFYNKFTDFKRMAEKSRYPLLIYNPVYILFESFDNLPSFTIQTVSILTVTVILLSSLFLPSFISILCIGISVFSVTAGIIAFLLHWNVPLDYISLTAAMVTCGFSVDYSAHICYAYSSCKDNRPNERLRNAVRLVGKPIFQGSITTILCVIILAFFPSSNLIVTTKVYSLASIISALHGIVFIPVLLSVLDSVWQKCKSGIYYLKGNGLKISEPVKGIANVAMEISVLEN